MKEGFNRGTSLEEAITGGGVVIGDTEQLETVLKSVEFGRFLFVKNTMQLFESTGGREREKKQLGGLCGVPRKHMCFGVSFSRSSDYEQRFQKTKYIIISNISKLEVCVYTKNWRGHILRRRLRIELCEDKGSWWKNMYPYWSSEICKLTWNVAGSDPIKRKISFYINK